VAERRKRRLARGASGFTLLEVLGAVAVMGISYALLATVAIESLRSVGDSQRRIDASLLADEKLAEIELAVELGELIELRDEEYDEEPFLVHIEVLDMEELYPPSGGVDESTDLISFLAAEAAGPFAPHRTSNWLLGYLREVHVTVLWVDGANERAVTRSAFIYDQQAWMEAEGERAAAEAEEQSGDGGNDDDEGDRR
jgi:hypothetical protein